LRQTTTRARAIPCALLSMTLLALGVAPVGAKTAGTVAPGGPRLTVSQVRDEVVLGRSIIVQGTLRGAGERRDVGLQILGSGGRWRSVDHDRVDARGRYRLTWRAGRQGTHRLRLNVNAIGGIALARRDLGRASIYRRAFASWYGPGLYGGHLACGGRLSAGTLGVANKTLPCGTRITLRYGTRRVRVPVVDRGPFVAGREFDLTAATRARLGFGSTGTVLTTAAG
jgi:rare lipoprotein A